MKPDVAGTRAKGIGLAMRSDVNTELAARLADGYETVNALGDSRLARGARARKGITPAPCAVRPGEELAMLADRIGCIDIAGGDGAN